MGNTSMRYLGLRWGLPYRLSHVCIFGQTGSGKSQTIKSMAERAYLRGNVKILDLYSGGSEEGAYYSLESNHPFWKNREYNAHNKKTKKMSFPTNCLIPISKGMPKNLPDIYTPFTIPTDTINENDLKSMLGGDLSKSEIMLWRRVQEKIGRNTTLIDLMNYMIDAKKDTKDDRIPGIHATGISSVYNMFNGFEKHHLFTKHSNKHSLDLLSELKNKRTITSLILKYFPEEYWGFIVNYFIHLTYELVLQRKIKHNVLIIIRDAGDFLEGMTDSPQEEAVKKNMIHVLRKGRKHRVYFWIDNQTPLNMDIIRTQFPVKICHFVDNTEELKGALGDLGSMLLNKEDYFNLMTFGPGKCYILTPSGLFSPQILPPLSRMSGEEGNEFFEIWRNEKGSRFKNINEFVNEIMDEYDESRKKWKELLKQRKVLGEVKKQEAIVEKEKIRQNLRERKKIESQLLKANEKIDEPKPKPGRPKRIKPTELTMDVSI